MEHEESDIQSLNLNDTNFDTPQILKLRISKMLNESTDRQDAIAPSRLEQIPEVIISEEGNASSISRKCSGLIKVKTKFSGTRYYIRYKDHILYLLADLKLSELQVYDVIKDKLNIQVFTFYLMFLVNDLDTNEDLQREILSRYNQMMRNSLDEYSDVSYADLHQAYDSWESTFIEEYSQQEKTLKQFEDAKKEISEIDIPEYTLPIDVKKSLVYDFSKDGKQIKQEEILDFFNSSKNSERIPYIQCNDSNGERYYKIWNGIDRSTIRGNSSDFTDPETIFGWFIPEGEDFIVKFSFPFLKGIGVFSIDEELGVNILPAIEEVRSCFSCTFTSSPKETKVSKDFEVYGPVMYETSFVHLLMNDNRFGQFIYIDEVDEPLSKKQRLHFHFGDPGDSASSVVFTITQLFVKPYGVQLENLDDVFNLHEDVTKELILVVNGEERRVKNTYKSGHPYILISITRSLNTVYARKFIEVITRLISLYGKLYEGVINEYKKYIPDFVDRYIEQKTKFKEIMEIKSSEIDENKRKLFALKRKAPNVFHGKFASFCGIDRRPEIISDDKLESWLAEHPLNGRKRHVLRYPDENPYNIVCPNDDYPYPQLKSVKDEKGRTMQYPCCYKDPKSLRTVVQQARKTKDYVLTSGKVAEPGRTADVNDKLKDILKATKLGKTMSFLRLGVQRGENSILHCIYLAKDPVGYERAENEGRLEDVVRGFRNELSEMNLLLARQETQESLDAIKDELIGEGFIDSRKYVRLLEELFDINIFVFSYSKRKENKRIIVNYQMEIPYFKGVHVPSKKISPGIGTILLNRLESEDQYELIILSDSDNIISVQPDVITEICLEIYKKRNESFVVSFDDVITTKPPNRMKEHVITRYYPFDVTSIADDSLGQILDKQGHAIAFLLKNEVSVHVPPTYPRNLLEYEDRNATKEKVLETFGTPSYAEVDADGVCLGYWFKLHDVLKGIFCPTYGHNPMEGILHTKSTILSNKESQVDRVYKVRRMMSILMQIYKWVYFLMRQKENFVFQEFSDLFVVDELVLGNGDTTLVYGLENFPRKLPTVVEVQEAMQHIELNSRGISTGGRFIMYSEKYKEKVLNTIARYHKSTDGISFGIPERIVGFYTTNRDFQKNENSKVFVGKKNLNSWIDYMEYGENYLIPHRKITLDLQLKKNAYPVRFSEIDVVNTPLALMYMIQNTVDSSIERAFTACISWIKDSYNPGYKAFPYKNPGNTAVKKILPKHVVYGLTASGGVSLIADNSFGSNSYLEVVKYTDGKFAAMLRLT